MVARQSQNFRRLARTRKKAPPHVVRVPQKSTCTDTCLWTCSTDGESGERPGGWRMEDAAEKAVDPVDLVPSFRCIALLLIGIPAQIR